MHKALALGTWGQRFFYKMHKKLIKWKIMSAFENKTHNYNFNIKVIK